MTEEFELYDVEVHVFKHDGTCDVNDWDRKDIIGAKEYAEETAFCEDVVKTIFRDSEAESDIETLNYELFERVDIGKYRSKTDGEIITFEHELAA